MAGNSEGGTSLEGQDVDRNLMITTDDGYRRYCAGLRGMNSRNSE
jgi:hypothetical protein